MAKISRSSPGAADLDINGGVIGTKRNIQPHVNPIFPRDFIAKSGAAG